MRELSRHCRPVGRTACPLRSGATSLQALCLASTFRYIGSFKLSLQGRRWCIKSIGCCVSGRLIPFCPFRHCCCVISYRLCTSMCFRKLFFWNYHAFLTRRRVESPLFTLAEGEITAQNFRPTVHVQLTR